MGEYKEDIKKMMYVCGDCSKPSADSAALVETVTRQQIVQLVEKAMEGGRQRGHGRSEPSLSVEDILFLMRRNKEKIKQVLYQMNFNAQTRRASRQSQDGAGGRGEEGEEGGGGGGGGGGGRRRIVDTHFLLDMFGEEFYTTEEVIQLKKDRMEHHDSRTKGMDSHEYMNYVQCRQVSFVKNLSRFRKWLELETVSEGQSPSNDVVEVLAYLAYDSVRELVELSLLVKQDMERRSHDPVPSSLLLPPSSSSTSSSSKQRTSSQSSSSREAEGGGSGEITTSSGTRASRSRKRKKSVTTTDGQMVSDESRLIPNQNGMGVENSGRGIQPSHIREALRRLSLPSGPLLPLATHHHTTSYTQKTLCL